MRKRNWLRWILIACVLLLGVQLAVWRILRTEAARQYLIAHLVASFGRPVEVGRFEFSLLDGARLEAHSVTVAEDPHFGNEYFLRAETLSLGLRWPVLLSGRFEFGSLSLVHPSLNLVRDADGRWNMERWLPPAQATPTRLGFVGPPALPSSAPPARLYRIQVEGGRINFKQLNDKSPFALLDVSGRVDQDSTGRWRLDLDARPMRAGVELQVIGMLHLRGTIGGTSARLQPAELNLTWRNASLADALRLARQVDYGMRGELSMDLDAKIGPPAPGSPADAASNAAQWSVSATARLTGVHGWGLPERDTDPAANLSLEAGWRLGDHRAEILKLLLEMPGSHLQASGDMDWSHGFHPQLHIESSSVGASDVLSWYRALRPGVAEDLRASGAIGLDLTLGGWPIELQQGAIAGGGVTLTGASLPAPLQIGAMNASVSRGGLDFAPTEVSFSSAPTPVEGGTVLSTSEPPGTFLFRGSVFPEQNGLFHWPMNWNLSIDGATSRVQDWSVLSAALAQPLHSEWSAEGGLAVKVRGVRRPESSSTAWLGTVDFRDLTLSSARVSQPVRLHRSHVEFGPMQRTVTLLDTAALGASWNGMISRKNSDKQWSFDLSADRLDTAEMDRWLGPRARPGFLARFANLGAAAPDSVSDDDPMFAQISARGRLRAGEIVIASMRLEQFDGTAELAGRTIKIRNAQAGFFGGKVAGMLDADLVTEPSYAFQGRFDRVNLAQLGNSVSFLAGRISGIGSGALSLTAHGIGREKLVGSIEGNGTIAAKNVEFRGVDFAGVFPGNDPGPSMNSFASVDGAFLVHAAGIDLENVVLDHSRGRLRAEGRIDFSHALNLRVRPSIFEATTSPAAASPSSFLLTGTIEEPKLGLPNSNSNSAAKSGIRGR